LTYPLSLILLIFINIFFHLITFLVFQVNAFEETAFFRITAFLVAVVILFFIILKAFFDYLLDVCVPAVREMLFLQFESIFFLTVVLQFFDQVFRQIFELILDIEKIFGGTLRLINHSNFNNYILLVIFLWLIENISLIEILLNPLVAWMGWIILKEIWLKSRFLIVEFFIFLRSLYCLIFHFLFLNWFPSNFNDFKFHCSSDFDFVFGQNLLCPFHYFKLALLTNFWNVIFRRLCFLKIDYKLQI
jgi:hypothetical protein